MVAAFEKASQCKVPVSIETRRKGDLASSYADSSKAKKLLGWQAKFDIDKMCEDVWRWQSQNPNGYGED